MGVGQHLAELFDDRVDFGTLQRGVLEVTATTRVADTAAWLTDGILIICGLYGPRLSDALVSLGALCRAGCGRRWLGLVDDQADRRSGRRAVGSLTDGVAQRCSPRRRGDGREDP